MADEQNDEERDPLPPKAQHAKGREEGEERLAREMEVMDGLLHSAVDTDQVIILEADLARESARQELDLRLENIRQKSLRNASLLRQVRRKLIRVQP